MNEFIMHRYPAPPLLTPQADYELTGHVRNVCFPCGCLVDEEKDEVRIYYGASDEFVCLATGSLTELIDTCKKGFTYSENL